MRRALKNFITGMRSSIQILPVEKNEQKRVYYKPPKSVLDAMRRDWYRVGEDINKSIKNITTEKV